MARFGASFRVGRGAHVYATGGAALGALALFGSMRFAVAIVFLALFSLIGLLKVAGQLSAASSSTRRRVAAPYLRDSVAWETADTLVSRESAPVWAVYAIGKSFFTGRYPTRARQLRAFYPDQADQITAVAVFPSGDLARSCARGLQRNGFSADELVAVFGRRTEAAAAAVAPMDRTPPDAAGDIAAGNVDRAGTSSDSTTDGEEEMRELGFVEAFAKHGAKLVNPQWAVSAMAEDGALVVSCWGHLIKTPAKGVMVYEDHLSRWDRNKAGSSLLRGHLEEAMRESLPVRLVIATAEDPALVDRGDDASKTKKTFHIPDGVEGRVIAFDGDKFVIEFRKLIA